MSTQVADAKPVVTSLDPMLKQILGYLSFIVLCGPLGAVSADDEPAKKTSTAEPMVEAGPVQTLGGQQLWTDLRLDQGWRIQQHALTGHCRLLDNRNRRWVLGDFATCAARLQEVRQELALPPMQGRAAILLHGLADTRWVMAKLQRHLVRGGDYDHVFCMSYASTRNQVARHAEALASVVAGLEGVQRIDLVGYSLGAIVIRRYWAAAGDAEAPPDARIGRVVMLGPPNRGACLANRLCERTRWFEWIAGSSAFELGAGWETLASSLATPSCEFGILAGAVAARGLDNPMVQGDDDMIVGVDETRLAGAADFAVLPLTHTELPQQATICALTARFLQHGYFKSPTEKRPIGPRIEHD